MTRESDSNEPAADAARAVGRGLLWVVIAVAIVVVVLGMFLIGPLGLIIVIPALLAIWFAVGFTAGGPAAGA
jgi:Na+/pantothenate symporter